MVKRVQPDATSGSLQTNSHVSGKQAVSVNTPVRIGLRLPYLHDSGHGASPKVSLTEPEIDPFAAAFSEDLLRFEFPSSCYAISPSGSSTSTLFSPEDQTLSLQQMHSPESPQGSDGDYEHDIILHERSTLSRSCASEFTPTTSARAYSPRFPLGHALCAAFVQKYALEAELGSGGYGFVMAARNRYDDLDVAVKFITKEKIPTHAWAVDDEGNEVPLEAKLLAVVSHQGIVKFHDLYDDERYFYLVRSLHLSVLMGCL